MTAQACPGCGSATYGVGPLTLKEHVPPSRLVGLGELNGARLCRDGACPVAYALADGQLVDVSELPRPPFHKSSDPERLVCFCFEHSVGEVELEAAETSAASAITASIKAACREGRDDCERKNPAGRCCLGNIAAVHRATSASPTDREEASARPPASTGLVAAGGAVVAAVLSSACCWLPLAFVGAGVSSAGFASAFEPWRWPLLGLTAALLGGGFYFVYRRPSECDASGSCPPPRASRATVASLWVAGALVVAFGLFPQVVTAFTGDGARPVATVDAVASHRVVVYAIDGMTCGGCAGLTRDALLAIDQVESAVVSYETGRATVTWRSAPDDKAVKAAMAQLGYTASRTGGGA